METIHVFLDMSGKEMDKKKKSLGYQRHYINKFNKLTLNLTKKIQQHKEKSSTIIRMYHILSPNKMGVPTHCVEYMLHA
jgi:predicted AAA+ superfamily ATPase